MGPIGRRAIPRPSKTPTSNNKRNLMCFITLVLGVLLGCPPICNSQGTTGCCSAVAPRTKLVRTYGLYRPYGIMGPMGPMTSWAPWALWGAMSLQWAPRGHCAHGAHVLMGALGALGALWAHGAHRGQWATLPTLTLQSKRNIWGYYSDALQCATRMDHYCSPGIELTNTFNK